MRIDNHRSNPPVSQPNGLFASSATERKPAANAGAAENLSTHTPAPELTQLLAGVRQIPETRVGACPNR